MSRGTLDPDRHVPTSDTGLSPSLAGCSNAVLLSFHDPFCQSEPRNARIPVWALPRSLAATGGIDVSFSSSGYLDVSVHRVSPPYTMDSCKDTCGLHRWVSPFRYLRINGYLHLPVAFRSLSRLSSALSAKASALRPTLLDLLSAASQISLRAAALRSYSVKIFPAFEL